MSPRSHTRAGAPAALRAANQLAVTLGQRVRSERRRRRWSLAALAARAGISSGHLCELEGGQPASLETYARVFTALDLPLEIGGEQRDGKTERRRDEDFVHAAMAELQARRLRADGLEVAIDEPYQHYQFAGRADVVAWDRTSRALLHIENRTQFPNVQEALGSYGTKRAYLGNILAVRFGLSPGGWTSETHVIIALWSSEVIRVARLRETTFRVACPDSLLAFRQWWAGEPSGLRGTSSSLAFFDPASGARERFRFISIDDLSTARPRYSDYFDAATRLREPASPASLPSRASRGG